MMTDDKPKVQGGIIPPGDPRVVRVPRPLTDEEQLAIVRKKIADRKEVLRKQKLEDERKVKRLLKKPVVNPLGPKHADKPRTKEKKEVVPFDPFAPRKVGTVNWEAQAKARDQQRTAGKRKNQSGEKKGRG